MITSTLVNDKVKTRVGVWGSSRHSIRLIAKLARTFSVHGRGESYKTLTIGDSHAVRFHGYIQKNNTKNKNVLLWLGPRLMYSIAQNGFGFTPLQKLILRAWNPDLCFIWLGEIDVRMHLVKHRTSGVDQMDWLEKYFSQLDNLRKVLGNPKVIVFSPVPQSVALTHQRDFHSDGSLLDRIEAQSNLICKMNTLHNESSFHFIFINITSPLQDPDGSLLLEYSDDCCHLNQKGFENIEILWDKYLIQ